MADVYGVKATDAYTGDPRDKAPNAYYGGFARYMMDEYGADGLAAGSDIRMGEVPAGAVLVEGQIDHDAMGAGVTLQLVLVPADGEGSDVTLTSATAADSAGTIAADNIDDVLQLDISKKHFIVVRTAGASATGTIKSRLAYTTVG